MNQPGQFKRHCERCNDLMVWATEHDADMQPKDYLVCDSCGYQESIRADIEAHAEGRPRLPGMEC